MIGYHPSRTGVDRVKVVSCKSWQGGFVPSSVMSDIEQNKKASGRPAWKGFRELVSPKWSEAFLSAVESATGQKEFTYVLAVTKVVGSKTPWEKNPKFIQSLGGNPIEILDLRQMLNTISPVLSKTLAGTEVGRMLQLFKVAGISIESKLPV